jgi:hypothetical protein
MIKYQGKASKSQKVIVLFFVEASKDFVEAFKHIFFSDFLDKKLLWPNLYNVFDFSLIILRGEKFIVDLLKAPSPHNLSERII